LKTKFFVAALIFIFAFCCIGVAYENKPLPASLTDKERKIIKEYIRTRIKTGRFSQGPVPDGTFFAPAEYDPAEAVMFGWAGYSYLLTKLIKEVTAYGDRVVVVCSSDYSKDRAKSQLKRAGVNMEKVSFIVAPLNSVWMRDYGPWFVLDNTGDRGVIDLIYNRPRPQDDRIPQYVAKNMKFKLYKPRLILPGGNLFVDGKGTAFMTDVVFDPSEGGDPSLTKEKLAKIFRDYFNCERVVILEKMKRDGTGHIDMFCKLLPDNIIIVGEYAKPSDGAADNYYILNRNAEKLAKLKDLTGKPYKVVRIPMPRYTGTSYTYTNSLIINKTVLVPIYGKLEDKKALEVYKKCLPGYRIIGVNCNDIIHANGAIHCITKLIMKPQLKVKKLNIVRDTGKVRAEIYSLKPLKDILLYYRDINDQPRSIRMKAVTESVYEVKLPENYKSDLTLFVSDIRGMHKILKF